MRSVVVVQVTLTFILDVEGEYVAGEILPLWAAVDAFVAMLENVPDAVLKVVYGARIGIPPFDVVVLDRAPRSAVYGWEIVFVDIGVTAPASELVAVVQGNGKLNTYISKSAVVSRKWVAQ